MAYWDPNAGWQTFSYLTNYKTDYQTVDPYALYPYKTVADFQSVFPYKTVNDFAAEYPYKTTEVTLKTALDFADQYPYKTEADFTADYPANRETSVQFWTKIASDGSRLISWTQPTKGSDWNIKTISYVGALKDQFSDSFRNSLSDSQKDLLRNKITELNTNYNQNNLDIQSRTTAANSYNLQQDALRQTVADTYNAEQEQLTQAEVDAFNRQQDTLRQQTLTEYNQLIDDYREQAVFNYNTRQDQLRDIAIDKNLSAEELNEFNQKLNIKNQTLNSWSQEVATYLQNSKTGTPESPAYVNTRDNLPTEKLSQLLDQGLITENEYNLYLNTAEQSYKTYYLKTRLSPWDPKSGAQPPVGAFDALYYRSQAGIDGQSVDKIFSDAVNNDDLDILGRFDRNLYAHYHYTTVGQKAGARGNAAQDANLVQKYAEYLTDADYQMYRDRVLGVGEGSILGGEVSALSTKAEAERERLFGAMTLDTLRESLKSIQEAKQKEQEFELYSQLGGFKELTTLNQDISSSILGDFGAGGIIGWMGGTENVEKKFTDALSKVTGISTQNAATYNWQKWFDEQLVKRYQEGATFQDLEDPTKTYVLDKQFADNYIQNYLKPRFDSSKSMSEFTSYVDVSEAEQNIFQTQNAVSALKDIADLRAKAYLDQIYSLSNTQKSKFDPEFYLNPTGNFSPDDPKIAAYNRQRDIVNTEYEAARNNPNAIVPGTNKTWAQWAYQYGLDINDRLQFARLHYQLLGGTKYGFDGARDVITFQDANDYIQNAILPEIITEKNALGDVTFMNFVTPETFADEMLRGIDPMANKEEWQKLLESQGLGGQDLTVEQVKEYIISSFRTNAAEEIRSSIKYLNEKRLRPTQERLGVEYIERPGDATSAGSPEETELYKIFRNAGYGGTEDEFYEKFMTDIDKGEMELFTQSSKPGGLRLSDSYSGITSSDPFKSIASMENLFSDQTTTTTTGEEEEAAPSYFRMFEDSSDEDYKSDTGKRILGEFTSLFKGFS